MSSELALRLPADPLALLERNDRFRVYTRAGPTPEADIWTLREALPEIRRAAAEDTVPCPVLHPADLPRAGPIAPPEEGGRALAPWLGRVLRTWRFMGARVYVVGGAAAWLAGLTSEHDDVDLGVVVPEELNTQEALWAMLINLVNEIYEACAESGLLPADATLLPGILSLFSSDPWKVQVILRAFPSLSTLLHGFDLPSSCVAFDGEEILLTSAAAYACAHRVNVVCPAYRSTTFERRLGKYFDRGVSLGFAHAPDHLFETLKTDGKIAFAHMTIKGTVVPGGANRAIGSFTWWDESRTVSDYDPAAASAARHPLFPQHQFRFNVKQIIAIQRGAAAIPLLVTDTEELCETFGSRPPTMLDALPARMARGGPNERLFSAPVAWFIIDDPSRQYTGSLNPRIEDPAAWYAAPSRPRATAAK